jgi:hypothetical protein
LALKSAMGHPDAETRNAAGRALRKIAPELTPPISDSF